MIRISRLTDYGIVLMSHMAADPARQHNAAELAVEARLPAPTVSKLLRMLGRDGLLASHRGVKGGYSLTRAPQQITVADVIRALEGPIALTTCNSDALGECEHEQLCPVRGHWHRINRAVREALEGISMSEMASAVRPMALPLAIVGRPEERVRGNAT